MYKNRLSTRLYRRKKGFKKLYYFLLKFHSLALSTDKINCFQDTLKIVPVTIQYKCLVPIYVFQEMKLHGHVIFKIE
jgi:hypothetical protein